MSSESVWFDFELKDDAELIKAEDDALRRQANRFMDDARVAAFTERSHFDNLDFSEIRDSRVEEFIKALVRRVKSDKKLQNLSISFMDPWSDQWCRINRPNPKDVLSTDDVDKFITHMHMRHCNYPRYEMYVVK